MMALSGLGLDQPAVGSQQSAAGSQQPAVSSQQSAVGSRQPAAGSGQPAVGPSSRLRSFFCDHLSSRDSCGKQKSSIILN